MPLTKCSEGGKSGWKWGNSGKCYFGPDARKRAIKQGFAYEPEKMPGLLKHEKSALAEFGDMDGVRIALGFLKKLPHKSGPNKFMDGITKYFSGKADPGQNSSDVNRGKILDNKDGDTSDVRDGEWSGQNPPTGDGSGKIKGIMADTVNGFGSTNTTASASAITYAEFYKVAGNE